MYARIIAYALLSSLCAAGASIAKDNLDASAPTAIEALSSQPVGSVPKGADRIRGLLDEILIWLSRNTELPPVDEPPRIAFVSPERIAALRYGAGPGKAQLPVAAVEDQTLDTVEPEVVAVYVDETQTIHLPVGWAGGTPAEVSVLVHELVHHLQKLAQRTFGCPQEREKAAYRAQAQWLAQFDRTLQSEFEIDPMTLLVRTSCMM